MPVVSSAPLIVVVPPEGTVSGATPVVPNCCIRVLALNAAWNVRSLALVINTSPSRVAWPTAPLKLTLPRCPR